MSDSLFLDADSLAMLVGWVGDYLAVGFGLALGCWVFGTVVHFLISVVRGGF